MDHILSNAKKLYCAFVDFTKTFDFVVRDIIWYKLIKVGIRGKILDIIRSMYTEVKSQVKYNNINSYFLVVYVCGREIVYHLFCFPFI